MQQPYAGIEQWQHDPGGGAASPEHQHAGTRERLAQVYLDVAHQPHPIGVVAEHAAIGLETQRVDRLGRPGARTARIGQLPGFALERQRDVGPATTFAAKRVHCGAEPVQRREDASVGNVLSGLAREGGVDGRRTAVCNRVSEDGVTVGHRVRLTGPGTVRRR